MEPVRCILLDIEGTTTPIDFVHQVLFPYARSGVKSYLATHMDSPEVQDDLAGLREEHARDEQQGLTPPQLVAGAANVQLDSMESYIQWLIDRDRKSSGLKSLQGKIWEQGYRDGALQAPLYADVLPALERWRAAGLKIAIFSSGSVHAQKLLFAHTQAGDITHLIDAYFDTRTGPKTGSESYRRIAETIDVSAGGILFISDVVAELDAATGAGLQTRLCVRPGNPGQPTTRHRQIRSFDELWSAPHED